MIQKLKLSNFQAHKSSELEFCPGVNAIVGESDEGKTSIIRALYWGAQNKPSGGDFISDFSKKGECSSTIVVDDVEIKRLKTKSKNQYHVSTIKDPLNAIGKHKVPDEVNNILQLSELNFQNQMDSPFLLSANGGEVARYLNEVADLNIISESLTKIKSRVDSTNRDIKSKEAEIESNKTELEEYNWINIAEKEIFTLENAYNSFKELETNQELLIDLLEESDDLIEKLDKLKERDDELYQICLLIKEWESWNGGVGQLDSFKSDLNSVKSISNEVLVLSFDKKESQSIVILHGLISGFIVQEQELLEFDNLRRETINLEDKIEDVIFNIDILEDAFKEEFPSECPLCGVIK